MTLPSDHISSATPLVSLSAVVLDTETTGLDTKRARIIQIGAVRLDKGKIKTDANYDRLIDPGEPISSASTEIHHIADEHVRGAPDFPTVIGDFHTWCGGAVILGYSIGFDLAMFKAEHDRAGLQWRPPRCLDVRHLVQVLAPPLPDEALDTAAGWLGLDVTDRHQAVADAVLTAEVFLHLVPKLREKGILTLAEAENACRRLTNQMTNEAQAGWHDVVRTGQIAPESVTALARIDSYPYRHQVGDIMHSPAFTISADLSIRRVLGIMMREQISSVFVEPSEAGGPLGIITERDVLRAIDTDPDGALDRPADKLAVRPLKTVRQDEYVYRAVGRMSTERLRHLGVSDDQGKVVGAISARDLLRQRAGDAMSLGDEIEQARSPGELGAIWTKLTMVAQGLTYEEVDPRDIAAIVSNELRALTRQACVIAEKDMAKAGKGTPPVPYAMMVLGSGGRGESLLAMDQDNAIVFETGEPGGPEDQ
ncbi:MAG: exonuclease domain-containing protein, partial [Hyphomicrobiales bacterium]